MSDSEEDYLGSEGDMKVEENEPPAGVTGLALAEHYFGPLLSPVAATPAQWTAYTAHRQGLNADRRNVFDHRKRSISDSVATIERELGLHNGTLQKCISIMSREIERDDVKPRKADILVRIYSPAAPKYVDVHINYYCRSRLHSVDWFYSIGYNIYNRISGSPIAYDQPFTECLPSMFHTGEGWQSICWGYYDDENNYGLKSRRIEMGDVVLHENGVLDVHEALFGPIEEPPSEDVDAVLVYRRKLVTTVRLLFAALGIDYTVACTDEETDEGPYDYMLEGLSDKWIARGIRMACGFQLSDDEEAAKRAEEERRREEEAEEEDSSQDEQWMCVGVRYGPVPPLNALLNRLR